MSTEEEAADVAEAAPEAAADSEQTGTRRKRRQKRKRGYWIWSLLTLLLIGGAGAGVGWILWTAPSKPSAAHREEAAPVALELPEAPALSVSLAPPDEDEAAIAAGCREALAKVSLIAAALGPDLPALAASLNDAVAMPDQRQAGKVEPPAPYQRWEMRLLPDTSLETYARGLDFFKVELGIIGGSKEIVYVSNFTKPKPEQRTALPRKDRRLYLTWRGSAMADQILADRAGISLTDKAIAQFCPPEMEEQLADLERAYAVEHGNKNIVKTTFAMKPLGEGFVLVVVDQQAGEP